MMCGLMPFYDSVVEKEFLLLFNSRKAWLDKLIILYLVYQYIITATQSGNWDFVFIMISLRGSWSCLLHMLPGYSQWRNYIAILLYAPRLTFVFYMARKNFGSFRAGTFTMAVKRVGFHCARFKMPMNFALGVQVEKHQISLEAFVSCYIWGFPKPQKKLKIRTSHANLKAVGSHLYCCRVRC
eukprot:jgi/Botrbrau1/9719/Bobra.0388s0012.1